MWVSADRAFSFSVAPATLTRHAHGCHHVRAAIDLPATARMKPVSRASEWIFRTLCLAMACAVIVLVVLVGYQLWSGAGSTFQKFGPGFLTTSDVGPEHRHLRRAAVHLRHDGHLVPRPADRHPVWPSPPPYF